MSAALSRSPDSVPSDVHIDVVRRWLDAVNNCDVDALDALVDRDVVDHSGFSAPYGHGLRAHKELVRQLKLAIPDWSARIDQLSVLGDRVTVRFTGTGRALGGVLTILRGASDAPVIEVQLVSTVRICGGRIVEHWATSGDL